MSDKVIFQRFLADQSRYPFPYPPVWRDVDTEYLCFTNDDKVTSTEWKIQKVDSLNSVDLEPYLQKYEKMQEIFQHQIQMGTLWDDNPEANKVTIPALEDLPGVRFDAKHFEPTADEAGNYIYRSNPVYQKGKYNGRPLLLTIGVPVSNQIDTIDRCLSHIKPLLDALDAELLVIDTGSTDGTLDVCRQYGARIVSHSWHDNMSAVRNEGIYHAKGQWYLSIDDDEWFEDVTDILEFFRKGTYRNYDVAAYIQRNYGDSDGNRFEDFYTPRMSAIVPDLHFEGRIHDGLVRSGHLRIAVLPSYAHHYGFVNDKPQKAAQKFLRNVSILIYDVYEYPYNLRYLFQLANEYNILDNKNISTQLFVLTLSLAKELQDERYGKNSIMGLLANLYVMRDQRLFVWGQCLEKLFPLTISEQADIAWYQERLSFELKSPAKQIIQYYEKYNMYLQQYRQDSTESRYSAYHGLSLVEHDNYIMIAEAIACWNYMELAQEERALELLHHISFEIIGNKRTILFGKGFAATDAVYKAICDKITVMQWEEWSRDIISAMAVSLKQESIYERQSKRFSEILSRISVSSVATWAKSFVGKKKGQTGEQLVIYALACRVDSASVQKLCLCSWILKEAYIKKRNTPESNTILQQYILTTGMFAACYYSQQELLNENGCVIAPDIRAVYRMALALSDGQASIENVTYLKQALVIFPSFCEEIKSIIGKLKA